MRKYIAFLAAICIAFTACSRKPASEDTASAAESAAEATESQESVASADNPFPGFLPESAAETSESPDASQSVPQMDDPASQSEFTFSQMSLLNNQLAENMPDDNYRTTYEVFVYSFADSDGDGIGDLEGLYTNLGYINDGQPSGGVDLGANEIWLMPIFPSPTYHKYDTTNYMEIDPDYGTLEDFDKLLEECHARGVNVILDLALNHTSTEHPWFVSAKQYLQNLPEGKDPVREECPYVWYYTFSREKYAGFEALDDTWYYEARFCEGMPDLNLSTPEVRDELREVMKFWLDRGIDGFRLDAVTSYFTDSYEGNVDFMTWVADTVHGIDPEAYLVAEAWENQASYSRYYSTGVNSLFDFAYSGAEGMIAATVKGDMSAKAYAESLVSEEELYASINGNYINAPFYTNHDMDRSADYYANDDGSRTKFAEGLNLMMTGNAFVYYGEELGMEGSGKDENKRAPMYWISKEETDGMIEQELFNAICDGPPLMDDISMKFGSAYAQIADEYSIYNYVRNAIRIRNAFPVIARGRTVMDYDRTNDQLAAFVREDPAGKYEPVEIYINSTDESVSMNISETSYVDLKAVLTVSADEVVIEDGTLTLPAFGICVCAK